MRFTMVSRRHVYRQSFDAETRRFAEFAEGRRRLRVRLFHSGVKEVRKSVDETDGVQAYADNLADEVDYVAGIVVAVGDGIAFDLVLVDDPFEGGAGAEAVIVSFRRDAGQEEGFVDADGPAVFRKLHFAFDALGIREGFSFDLFERPGFEGFVIDVEMGELATGAGESMEVRRERDARELALEVGGIAFAVAGQCQDLAPAARRSYAVDTRMGMDGSAVRMGYRQKSGQCPEARDRL